jgi:hypothetical protein
MKFIVALAVLCVAAQAAHLNISAYHLGFAENLGLNEAQIQHGFNCFNSFKNVLLGARDVVHYSEPSRLLLNIMNLIEEVEEDLKGTCKTYLMDLAISVYTKTQGADLKLTIGSNWNKYPLQIIQQVALWVRAMESGDMYAAGNIEASIINILLGTQTPYVLPTPTFNYTKYTQMNMTRYMNEFTSSYYQTLGINSQAIIESTVECQISTVAFVEKIQGFEYKLQAANNYTAKFHVIHDLLQLGSASFHHCGDSLKMNWRAIYVPLIEVFRTAPGHSALHILKNIALNLPEIQNLKMQEVVDILEGNYKNAGASEAKILLALVEGLF